MLLIRAILLLRSSPNNHCDPVGTFIASGLILSGSLDLKLFPKRARASTSGVVNSLLYSCRRLELIILSEATVTA